MIFYCINCIIFFSILFFFIGGIPFGLIIGKVFKKIDIREHGSGNIGATNVGRVIGKKYADRNGGYTRIMQTGPRRGDAAPMAILELV